jgi:hypothetical protein
VSDEINSDSIVSEIGERLDDIFGEDEGKTAPVESGNGFQLDELRGLLFTFDREISDETIGAVNLEVKQLQKLYRKDTHVLALIKIMSLITGYMKLKKADVHPETISLLNSVFRCMENVIENKGLSTHERRTLVEKEINNFKTFKVKISSGAEPSAKETTRRIGEDAPEDSETLPLPDQQFETGPSREIFETHDGLRAFLEEELAPLKSRVDALKVDLASSDDSNDRLREELKSLKDQMSDLKVFSADFKDLRKYIRGEFTSVKGQIDDLTGSSDDFKIVQDRLAGELSHMKEKFNDLGKELSRLRDDLNVACNELEVMKGALSHFQTEGLPDKSYLDMEEIEDVEELPENSESNLDWNHLEQDLIAENAIPGNGAQDFQADSETQFEDDKSGEGEAETSDSSPGEKEPEPEFTKSSSYFLFQMGGKKYAVGEDSVIRVSKAGRRLLKKASEKGGLTMNDFKRVFSDIKRGIEPVWDHLTSKELEKTTFHLLTDSRIDGLLDTKGGGILFLGSGEKRSILFTDQLPKKEWLSREDKLKTLSGLEYVRGSIQKRGEDAEKYLVLDADKLCKRLRVSIPAPFTKI